MDSDVVDESNQGRGGTSKAKRQFGRKFAILFFVACFFLGFTTANHWAITQTMAGPVAAGKWTGMQNAFGNLAGVIAPWLTGVILQETGSFYYAFVAVAVVVVFGAASFVFVVEDIKPIQWTRKQAV